MALASLTPAAVAEEVDLLRHSPVRYLGYANEVGESFRVLIRPLFVKLSYGIAFGYVGADAIHKAFRENSKPHLNTETRLKSVGIASGDTLLWQTFASVAIPGMVINRTCHLANLLLEKSKKLPAPARKWTVTFIGLSTIPFIVHPIDKLVDVAMDNSVRKIYRPE